MSPNQIMVFGVTGLVIALSAWIGVRARATTLVVTTSRRNWESTANQLATVQEQFKMSSTSESPALTAEATRLRALGIGSDDKLGLVDMLGHLAEAFSLSSVRVNVIPLPDSAVVPARRVPGSSIKPASYAIAVEFVGRFADAQKFVSSLPPSVSLSALNASRRQGGALYKLILSVYEIDANSGD